MIVWSYKELLEEIKNGKNAIDGKTIKALIRAMTSSGVDKGEIAKTMHESFDFSSDFSMIKRQIDSESKKAKTRGIITIGTVYITANEMSTIKEIHSKDAQKVLFCMIIFCKSRGVNYFYIGSKSEIKPKDIMEFARVPFSVKRFNLIVREIYQNGLITVEPNMKVALPFLDLTASVGQNVNVSKSSVEWLEVEMGRGIFCQRCGVFVKKVGNNKKYCPKCAVEAKKEKDKIRKLKI